MWRAGGLSYETSMLAPGLIFLLCWTSSGFPTLLPHLLNKHIAEPPASSLPCLLRLPLPAVDPPATPRLYLLLHHHHLPPPLHHLPPTTFLSPCLHLYHTPRQPTHCPPAPTLVVYLLPGTAWQHARRVFEHGLALLWWAFIAVTATVVNSMLLFYAAGSTSDMATRHITNARLLARRAGGILFYKSMLQAV